MCFSLNLTDDHLAALDVQGMLPTWKEKLLGQEFDNLGQLTQRVARSIANSRICAEIPDSRKIPQWPKLIIHIQTMTAMKMKKKRLPWLNGIGAKR